MAQKLDISESYYCQIENGERKKELNLSLVMKRSAVRLRSLAPRRSKLYIACSDFYLKFCGFSSKSSSILTSRILAITKISLSTALRNCPSSFE